MNKHLPQPFENSSQKKWNGYCHPNSLGWLLTDEGLTESLGNGKKLKDSESQNKNQTTGERGEGSSSQNG